VRGDVDTFLGIMFKHTELLLETGLEGSPSDFLSATHQRVPMWVKSGVLQATNPEIETEVVRRWDKRGSWYVYAMAGSGAVRMQETKVASILCDI
jgi:hypothetical protein